MVGEVGREGMTNLCDEGEEWLERLKGSLDDLGELLGDFGVLLLLLFLFLLLVGLVGGVDRLVFDGSVWLWVLL